MIRRVEEGDRAAVLSLLRQQPALNLYALGNIDANGFDAVFSEFWGDFDEQGRLRAVLNRYMTGWVIYGQVDAEWARLGEVVDSHPIKAERIQDNPGGIDSFLPYLRRYRVKKLMEEELMTLSEADFRPFAPVEGIVVRRAVWHDLGDLVAFYAEAEEMRRLPEAVERPLRERRIWMATVDSVPYATALTNAEIADQAMIGGVYTKTQARGQGFSRMVMSALCAELLNEGKQPVLYWENPTAGAVYRKLGFQPIGIWRSVRLEEIERS
jgi:uncharacterized protein